MTTHEFRVYEDSPSSKVYKTYLDNHTFQTYEHVLEMKKKHLTFTKGKMTVWEAISKLDTIVDESDPDIDAAQIFHSLQTAEKLRSLYPEEDWLHLIGLIHDLGKILLLPEFGGLPQWNVVGDTFPVGCPFAPKIVFSQLFANNPDSKDSRFNTGCGVYKPNGGLSSLHMSWGHDEYMYHVCLHNKTLLPPQALKIIRFHSFYPWHRDSEYQEFMDYSDKESLPWVQKFQKADLYSKTNDDLPSVDTLKPYYVSLIQKYFPSTVLEW